MTLILLRIKDRDTNRNKRIYFCPDNLCDEDQYLDIINEREREGDVVSYISISNNLNSEELKIINDSFHKKTNILN
jgi:hypothetical protein